ncbi:MAG: hypothetical protein EPO52_01495 [Herbiconiux sp.]|uniref:hypothetical protein n=1 Tax=Herbiconiux sp. TaxID=1871186 RepID=UPI00120FCC65|nr:hypothetical protein [Herbiconiux sp.]TAJ49661.1 MAG: hypothetical protein EPO52_01495 [Herbiconiux sp.]
MKIGDEVIFRDRDIGGTSERVLLRGEEKTKHKHRADIEFVEGSKAGRKRNVPYARIKGPWSGVLEYDALMAQWEALGTVEIHEVELRALEAVYGEYFNWEIAELLYGVGHVGATKVFDLGGFEALAGVSAHEASAPFKPFMHEESLIVSAEGSLAIAELLCRGNPQKMLAWVEEQEAEIRMRVKHGHEFVSPLDNEEKYSPPEREWKIYLERERPVFELIRQFCGYKAVNERDRLQAAEAEVNRLDILAASAIERLRELGDDARADQLAEEHDRDRITPALVRPPIDRPLSRDEIPVQYVYKRRSWPR